MKKVININFQGRIIPIEESAYELLTKYVESLRVFFANEEGRDEIINDIEGRIAELFSEVLKKGATCIADNDVNTIISSMGRPEDFDAEEGNLKSQLGSEEKSRERNYSNSQNASGQKKLFRDENHKLLGGVCAGIANYFGIDIVIARILFIVFSGVLFIPYLILWIAVPSSSSVVIGSQRKRLFRDPENKLIAGVCSGLAQYFSVQVWIPRIIFLIPFFSVVFRWGNWGWFDFPHFLSFSFSPGSMVVYIIFWLVLPEAVSAADKLEMKGEKVDLNNIKSTIQNDMEGFKDRAQQFSSEVKERAQEIGGRISKNSGGIGNVIAVIVKGFVYFILGSILFAVVVGLFSLGVVLTGFVPAYSYMFDDGVQRLLIWGTIIFFIWVPVIAIVTWIIRRLTGKKGRSSIISLTFTSLWIVGWICFINLIVTVSNEFRYRNNPVEQTVRLSNYNVNKLEIKSAPFGKYYNSNWFKLEPFVAFDEDTTYVRNVRLRIIKSNTDSFQVVMVKMANASSKAKAEQIVSKMNYNLTQIDSVLLLDKGIAISKEEKFRNQQIIITIAVPLGKRIYVNENTGWADGNDVHFDFGHNNDYWDWENDNETRSLDWRHNVEYVMTQKGLERVNKSTDEEGNNDKEDNQDGDDNGNNNALEQFKKNKEEWKKQKEQMQKDLEKLDKELQAPADSTLYRYNQPPKQPESTPEPKKNKATASRNNTDVPNGMNDTAVMKYAL